MDTMYLGLLLTVVVERFIPRSPFKLNLYLIDRYEVLDTTIRSSMVSAINTARTRTIRCRRYSDLFVPNIDIFKSRVKFRSH